VPTIQRFGNCKIAIYAGDHPPPHFHIEGRGWRATVEIETLAVLRGDARRAQEAMAWALGNVNVLRTEWQRLNRRDDNVQ